MPILSRVGRGQPAQRAVRAGIYALLSFGALCILYPMMLVFGQAVSNQYDLRDNVIVPHYLKDQNELALKYVFCFTDKLHLLASRHHRNQWTNQSNMRADGDYYAARPADFAAQGLSLDAWPAVLKDLNDFKQTVDPDDMLVVSFAIEDYYRPFLHEEYGRKADAFKKAVDGGEPLPKWFVRTFPEEKQRRKVLGNRNALGAAVLNHELRSDYLNYYSVEVIRPGNFTVPVWRPAKTAKMAMWRRFKQSLPPDRKLIICSDTYWHDFLQKKYDRINALNASWGTDCEGFYELVLPLEPPAPGPLRRDWEEFVVKRWPRRLLKLPPECADQWRDFVRRRFLAKMHDAEATDEAALREFRRVTGRELVTWAELEFPTSRPDDELMSRYWCEFTFSGAVPAEDVILDAPEINFRSFLRERYGGDTDEDEALAALNAAWSSSFKSFDDVPLPLEFADYAPPHFSSRRLRLRFVAESFKRILEYILGRSRAARNTIVLVVLCLASALTVNPLAAYSLSRFSMKQSHRILIFLLATIAFPAEVAMIPNFLLLRDLHLLNTYAALILPGMANGFSIFLLKCFFDSLPRELYEAAELDGASETQVFRLVALPLLGPILAYIGLGTFVAAYSGFMWAFVICPKEEMWTVMVWVYDFQSRNPGNNYIMAATILVSIPPLIVFLLANRIIMRGIMIPRMK